MLGKGGRVGGEAEARPESKAVGERVRSGGRGGRRKSNMRNRRAKVGRSCSGRDVLVSPVP